MIDDDVMERAKALITLYASAIAAISAIPNKVPLSVQDSSWLFVPYDIAVNTVSAMTLLPAVLG